MITAWNRLRLVLLAGGLGGLVGGLAGCRSLTPPSFGNPGPAAYQQSRAQRFDPYPENEPGPPVVGARPMEYEKPAAEVLRSRWWLSSHWRLP